MANPFEVDDLYRHVKVTALNCVAGVAHAVCSVRQVDRAQDGYVSALWRCSLDGAAPVRLTDGGHLDTTPRLSPDGRQVAFVSDRSDGAPQLHLVASDGGDVRQLTRFPGTVTDVRWHPDGAR